MNIFFDSSAWAKRYIEEKGSDVIESLCQQADQITLSVLCIPEIISAFARLRREAKLSEDQYLQLKEVLFDEIRDVRLINLTHEVLHDSVKLLEKYNLRTLDALHIACALSVPIDLFVTADRKQKVAAEGRGLKV